MQYQQNRKCRLLTECVDPPAKQGIKDILIACIDNLKGFSEAIFTVFPLTEVQSSILHQICNLMKYVANKDQKESMSNLKPVYQTESNTLAAQELKKLAEKWQKKYPVVIESCQRYPEKLRTCFSYPEAIRSLTYTTNAIKGYHRKISRVGKGISAQASHGTVRDSLPSYGSCYLILF